MFERVKDIFKNTFNPVSLGLASGLYPLLHYYNYNFTLINSWSQLQFFLFLFIAVPIIVFFAIHLFGDRLINSSEDKSKALTIANLIFFLGFSVLVIYGIKKKLLALALVIACVSGFLLFKYLKKIMLIQALMAMFLIFRLIPFIYDQLSFNKDWMIQPDEIESVKFIKTPNIYVIQPDGYANFTELKNHLYSYDNTDFETFLEDEGFKLYRDFRSNYFSTLTSNTSMFAMKHHYYNSPRKITNEMLNARDIIVGENPVLSVLKGNNYKTFLLLEKSYLLVNRPKMAYDSCNVSLDEVSYFSTGFDVKKDLLSDLEATIKSHKQSSHFYFIEKLEPSHIAVTKSLTKGREKERESYLKSLEEANAWLKKMISKINTLDPGSLIVLVSDHGGFVGMDYTLQSLERQTDEALVNTIFSSALAIKWPTSDFEKFDDDLKTSVNLYRVVFSYLSEDSDYLNNLQEDASYIVIKKGAPFGVYEYIDENSNIVFEKLSN